MNELKDLLFIFKQYFEFSGSSDWETGFRCGAFVAISTILFIAILLLLLRFSFFRKRPIRQLELDGEKGKYVISASAISDLLAVKTAEYPEVTLLKTKILPARNKKCKIVMNINYIPSAEAAKLQDLVTSLQGDVVAVLSDVFGITSVESVSICISRAKKKK